MKAAIVCSGYDKYSVLWPYLKHGYDKYWADCLWPKILLTSELEAPEGFVTVKTHVPKDWATHIIKGLSVIDEDIILFCMDDFWISGPVQTKTLSKFIDYFSVLDIDHIRLLPPAYQYIDKIRGGGKVTPERECKYVTTFDEKLWVFQDDAEYRASATIGLWRKDIFLGYLKDGMTPWIFEQEAGIASRGNDRYLCCVDPFVFPTPWYCNPYPNGKNSVVSRGKWDIPAYEYAAYEGLNIDFTVNPDGTDGTDNFKKYKASLSRTF